jgi:uncharacterized membrane protein
MQTKTPVALACVALLQAGCGKMAVDGEVVDAHGQAIPGARVASIGTQCFAKVGDDGKFALPCTPGEHTLVISAQGYTSAETRLSAPDRERYDLGKTVLVLIPKEKGLFKFKDHAYVPLVPGRLSRKLERDGGEVHRSFCLDKSQSTANSFKAGVHPFFDYEHMGWRPFKLDAKGCAYRDTKNSRHKWTVHQREKAPFEVEKINRGKRVALITLEKGEYFMADWKGFFTPANDDKGSYTGAWITVE